MAAGLVAQLDQKHQNVGAGGRAFLAGGGCEISGTANTSLSLSQLQCLSLTRPCCLAAVGTAMEAAAAGTFSRPIAPPYHAPRFPGRPATTSKRSASRDGTCSCSSHLVSCFQEPQHGWGSIV